MPMPDAATTAAACVGAAIAMTLRYTLPFMMKQKPRDSNGKRIPIHIPSGMLSPEEWEGRLTRLHHESEERLMKDIRGLVDNRMLTVLEKVTEPIVKEIRALRDDMTSRRRYNDDHG